MTHTHSRENVVRVIAAEYIGLPSYRVFFDCGCFGAWLANGGRSVTGAGTMHDFDPEWLAAQVLAETL